MAFTVQERRSGPVVILGLTGRLIMGEATDKLDAALRNLIDAGERSLLLDCAGVPVVDSQGIKSLVWGLTSLQKRGGKLKLLKITPRVREVLDMTRLLTVIEAFDDETQAVGSF
jgi:anti-sigma B factor antagonist